MSSGWENKEPAPLESMHGKLMDLFHEFRLSKGDSTVVKIDGAELNNIIAAAKRDTYEKYPNHVSNTAITLTAQTVPSFDSKESYMAMEKDQLIESLILAESLLSHSGVLIAHNHNQMHDIAFATEGKEIVVMGAGLSPGTCDNMVLDKKPEVFELTMPKMIDHAFIKEPSEKSTYPNPYSKKGGKHKFRK